MALPRAGSFQDAVLQEMIFREQNLKYSEVTLFTRLIQLLLGQLVELTTVPDKIGQRKALLHDDINVWLRLYEAELYQDRYMPAYQRAERERIRQEAHAEAERKVREAQALKKVAGFSEDDAPRKR